MGTQSVGVPLVWGRRFLGTLRRQVACGVEQLLCRILFSQLPQNPQALQGLLLVHDTDGEAGMDVDVVTHTRLRSEPQAYATAYPTHLDLGLKPLY